MSDQSERTVMPSEREDLHLQSDVAPHRADALSGASAIAGAQHPADNTANDHARLAQDRAPEDAPSQGGDDKPGVGQGRPLDWQPIETAPKDGTAVLLFGQFTQDFPVDARARYIGYWFEGYEGRGWWTVMALPFHATHWMPLPAPPDARRHAPEEKL